MVTSNTEGQQRAKCGEIKRVEVGTVEKWSLAANLVEEPPERALI
jgi:hypothetical protein